MATKTTFKDRFYKLFAADLTGNTFVECLLLADEAEVELQRLRAEVNAWQSRFTQYRYRPQDDCVALDA